MPVFEIRHGVIITRRTTTTKNYTKQTNKYLCEGSLAGNETLNLLWKYSFLCDYSVPKYM